MEALLLRRWACVLAVGGAVLAGEVGEAAAGAVAIAPPPSNPTRAVVTLSSRSAAPNDDVIARCLNDSSAAAKSSDESMAEDSGAAPVTSFMSVMNETVSAGTAVTFPPQSEQARPGGAATSASATGSIESFDADDGSGVPRIPPATLIPLPPGIWTGIGTLGGIGLISASRRVWRMR